MNRDTEELPRIMADMERHSHDIEGDRWVFCSILVCLNPTIGSEQLTGTREGLRRDLEHLNGVLDNLDELGEIMGLMLTTQDSIEVYPYSYPFLHNNLYFHRERQKRH
jgi:autophagy-related protein 17